MAPSLGVCRSAFASRLCRTRSTLSGAHITTGTAAAPVCASSLIPRARASAWKARTHEPTTRDGSAASRCTVNTPASMRASSKRSSTSAESVRTRSPSAGMYSCGSASPSSIASIIACIDASGVRRSWLAHATSSRRASKSRSIESAIALTERATSATSTGPLVGRACREISGGETTRRLAQAVERSADPARERQCDDQRAQRRRRRHREDLRVRVHLEHDPPGREHSGKRQQDREQRERGQLEAHRRQHAQKRRCERADRDRSERKKDRQLGHGVQR